MSTLSARLTIKMDILGEEQLYRVMKGRIHAVSDWSPAWNAIAADYKHYEEEQFDAEGAVGGNTKWAALSPEYAARKEKKYPGTGILTASGKLRRLMMNPHETIEPLKMVLRFAGYTVGTRRHWDLPALFQTGTKHMPARKVILLTKWQKSKIVRFIRKLVFGEK